MTRRAGSAAKNPAIVLVIEPCDQIRGVITEALHQHGIELEEERDGIAAWNRFLAREPGLILAALELPGLHGWELLARVRGHATTPFVFHSTTNDASTAISAMRAGADDFIVLPDEIESAPARIQALIERHLGLSVRTRIDEQIVGRSAAICRIREKLQGLAGLRVPVLVRGEPGTGRDHMVAALAATDEANSDGLVIVRPAAGRAPNKNDVGKVVYLDSVERLSLGDQHLWAQQIERTDREDAAAPRRILASTSADIAALARAGLFEAVLADRLAQFTVDLPPLRDRKEDISTLARALAGRVAARMGRARVLVTDPALQLLRMQAWPGNVRELEAVVERLVAYSQNGQITRSNVAAVFRECPSSVTALRVSAEKQQRDQLTELLSVTGGNLAEVGRRLGMSRGAVIYRAQKFGLLSKRC